MKTYWELEQKIIDVIREGRNTELRKKEANVGRPTDNNKDDTSKLAKQASIKTKIIDEDSEYGMARNELETAKRAIDRLMTKMGKGEGELEAWVQSKITKASDYLDTVADYIESGSVKEEVLDEKAKKIHVHHKGDTAHVKDLNGNIIASYNRREHGENYLRRAHAHLGKVYEDSVAGVASKDTPKEQPESKKKTDKNNDKDLVEPGYIKGGKTEVDLEPNTDDRDDEGKKDTDKSKIATRKANREGGIKEGTMNTSKNFGLPADLIATVTEALKGGQKKIDKNHNGKIDGQDFKMLRGKKKVEEEVETVDEAVNHREFGSKGKMHPTMAKGMKVGQHADFYGHGNGDKHYGMVTKNTGTAVHIKAAGKTHKFSVSHNVSEEVEELDERDMENKAKKNAAVAGVGAKNRDEKHLGSRGMKTSVADKIRGREVTSGNDRKQFEETDPGFSAEELARIEEIAKGLK